MSKLRKEAQVEVNLAKVRASGRGRTFYKEQPGQEQRDKRELWGNK